MRKTIQFELPRFDRYKTFFVNGCVLAFALFVHLFDIFGVFEYTYTELAVVTALAILAFVNICLRLVTCEPILETPWQRTLREISEKAEVLRTEVDGVKKPTLSQAGYAYSEGAAEVYIEDYLCSELEGKAARHAFAYSQGVSELEDKARAMMGYGEKEEWEDPALDRDEDLYSERRGECGFCEVTARGQHEPHCPHSPDEAEQLLPEQVINGHVDKLGPKH